MPTRIFDKINPESKPSLLYDGPSPHPNRYNAVDMDDFFESYGGTWRIFGDVKMTNFICGMEYADSPSYDTHHYFEYFDESLDHRVRYDHKDGYKTECTLLKKIKEKFKVGEDEFWDQYAEQLGRHSIIASAIIDENQEVMCVL